MGEPVGPPAMVEAMQGTLAGAGIAAEEIRTEEFFGYQRTVPAESV